MKNLKVVLVVMMFLGSLSVINAQRKVSKVYPKNGTLVKKVSNPEIITYNKVNYHYANGVWYKPQGRKYIVTAAPAGYRLKTLPRNTKVITLRNGKTLYKHSGITYMKTRRGFVVV